MDKLKIVGFLPMSFQGSDGGLVSGTKFFYVLLDSQKRDLQGQETGFCFLSAQKLAAIGYMPKVGDTVLLYYNRYGKPDSFTLIDDEPL